MLAKKIVKIGWKFSKLAVSAYGLIMLVLAWFDAVDAARGEVGWNDFMKTFCYRYLPVRVTNNMFEEKEN